jgi:lysozyme family protein
MAASTFAEAWRRLSAHEGGFVHHPADPGGPTHYGITLAVYRRVRKADATAADLRAMTAAEAAAIYRRHYWDALCCDDLPAGVDYAVFDYGVNSGVGRAGKVLRRLLGLPDRTHAVTAEVLAAVAGRDAGRLIEALCDERLAFLKRLKTWPAFGRGWARRVAEVRAAALAMAGSAAAPAPAPSPAHAPGKGEVPPPKAAKEALRTGAPLAGGGALAAAREWVAAHPFETALLVAALAAAVVLGLRLLAARHRRRQEAAIPGTPVVPACPLVSHAGVTP